jgi:hypothetical protein
VVFSAQPSYFIKVIVLLGIRVLFSFPISKKGLTNTRAYRSYEPRMRVQAVSTRRWPIPTVFQSYRASDLEISDWLCSTQKLQSSGLQGGNVRAEQSGIGFEQDPGDVDAWSCLYRKTNADPPHLQKITTKYQVAPPTSKVQATQASFRSTG